MLDNATKSAANVFKSNIQKLTFVEGFSMSSVVPGQEVTFRSYNLSNSRNKSTINCGIIGVDNDFFGNFDLRMIAGGTFSERDSSRLGVIVNEEVVTHLGFANAAESIGASILHSNKGSTTEFVIEGVVSNYHQQSLQKSFEPILFIKGTDIKFYSIKFAHGFTDLKRNLALIEHEFKKSFPNDAFHFFFLDQHFDNLYRSEVRLGSTLFAFSLLAIFVSALGLLSLSTFMITLRVKEVGIRKVMGASTLSITNLFLRDYFHLLAISTLIGTPVSYFISTYWLSSFAFKIEVSPLLLAIPIAFLSSIILFAVGFQSVRAASRNPADIIKSD
jgi:putative ABC transport system permease protein